MSSENGPAAYAVECELVYPCVGLLADVNYDQMTYSTCTLHVHILVNVWGIVQKVSTQHQWSVVGMCM